MNLTKRDFLKTLGVISAAGVAHAGRAALPRGRDATLVIAHCGDPQFGFVTSQTRYNRPASAFEENYKADLRRLETEIEILNDIRPDLVYFTGDMTQNAPDVTKDWPRLLKKIKSPVLVTPGNHDMANNLTAENEDRFRDVFGYSYTTRDVTALVREAERLMPGLGLGCDILTGFPDEMDYDFLATQSLLTRLPFNKYHVFPFSERPGTVAAQLPHAVPREIRHARAHEIADQGETARVRFVNGFKGKTVTIVVEDERRLAGWTSEYVWCEVGEEKANAYTRARGAGARQIHRRDLVEIAVKDVHGHVLAGDPV